MLAIIFIIICIIVVSLIKFNTHDEYRINKLNNLLSINNDDNSYLKLKEFLKEK